MIIPPIQARTYVCMGGGVFDVLNVKLWLNLLVLYVYGYAYKGLLSLCLQGSVDCSG